MDLLDDAAPSNAHAFTVSEISGAIRRLLEDEFARVRIRGEIGRVSRPGSGHIYFDLKDDRAVIAAVAWKGQVARLGTRPEEGIEVIATGRLTTFPGQSKYQLVVEQIEPAGAGALMVMLERRRKALAAEGLFDDARKRPLPWLPRVIGVVTSPTGAVIRDILHRLRERFPTRVLIWPVAVQGEGCPAQVAAAIRGFDALAPDGPIPRPDLVIVARGGGSLEDLWGFNDEAVVRAAAACSIPLISAVGHETDTTLIDFAADRRAPTPTAAAEMAVPVRADLLGRLAELGLRITRAALDRRQRDRQRLRDLGRALGRPQALTDPARQRLDLFGARLEPALRGLARSRRDRLAAQALPLAGLRAGLRHRRAGLIDQGARLPQGLARQLRARRDRLADLAPRLTRARARNLAEAARRNARDRDRLATLGQRLDAATRRFLAAQGERLARLERLRQTLGYRQTLSRGFAVVHGPHGLLTRARDAARTPRFEIEFIDGRLPARPDPDPAAGLAGPAPAEGGAPDQPPQSPSPRRPRRKAAPDPAAAPPPDQKTLF